MYKIFPVTLTRDGRKVPVKGFKWKEDCSSDPKLHAEWSTQYPQLKLWGVPTGTPNGILVLDVDVKGGGLDTILNYHVPLTMTQKTMSGGVHHIFKYPDDGKTYGNKVGFDNGLDIRGQDGYIAYYGFDSTPIAEAPDWLLEQALKVEKTINADDTLTVVSPAIVSEILTNCLENIRSAPEGESNNVLNVEAFKVGQLLPSGSIASDFAFNELFKAAKERGKEDYEATATIKSGLEGGSKSPILNPFGDNAPIVTIPQVESSVKERWTPLFFTKYDLTNMSKLRKPQIFKDWSTEDIQITTADGGTGKTTLKLVEAICLALGEDFLGFECMGEGRTLFITGEDTREKLGAMIGVILKQMKILDDPEKVSKVMSNILVKKDSDLCLISKTKQGFITINPEAIDKVMEAIEDFKPKLIVFDPISSFWGSEAALNDMSKAVAKFMSILVEKSNACVEVINHMGKSSSKDKDMTQFAGRGGTGLPSHARVSKVLRPVFAEEYQECTGLELDDDKSAMMCNVNKFSDGSPLYNNPFIIVRDGYLFSRVTITEQKVKEENNKMEDTERIFTYIRNERREQRYPTKLVVASYFSKSSQKISKTRVETALAELAYIGHMGEKIKCVDNPDIEINDKVYIITDMNGEEL